LWAVGRGRLEYTDQHRESACVRADDVEAEAPDEGGSMNDGPCGEAVGRGAPVVAAETSISLRINGATHDVELEPR
jgi:hypothetical protein